MPTILIKNLLNSFRLFKNGRLKDQFTTWYKSLKYFTKSYENWNLFKMWRNFEILCISLIIFF